MLWILVAGCASQELDPGVSFRISGPVDAAVVVDGETVVGQIAWVWLDDGVLCARADAVPFEPQVWRYAMLVTGPPEITASDVCVPAPPDLAGAELVAWGLPVLLVGDADVSLQVDPGGVVDWLAGTAMLSGALAASHGRVAAVAPEHLLLATASDHAWPEAWCRFDATVPGLTLYVNADDACGGWEPLAPPGTRTEFQGVGLAPLPE